MEEKGNSSPLQIVLKKDPHVDIPSDREAELRYTDDFFQGNGLYPWIKEFKLGTAGYRDTFNLEDFFATDAPYNAHTIMIVAEAMARIYNRRGYRSIHLGGEVRRYTNLIMELVGRIFASHGVTVHLNADESTLQSGSTGKSRKVSMS